MIVRRRTETSDIFSSSRDKPLNGDLYELHMMTSATLIEALYDAVDEWLALNTKGKTNITQLSEQDSIF